MARHCSPLAIPALLMLLIGVCDVVNAQKINETSSDDEKHVGWSAAPRGRGTLGILLNCAVTAFLCVWTTVQVNIEPERLPNKTLSRIVPALENETIDRWLAKRWVRKLGWSVISVVFPEVMVAVAMFENRTAKLLKDEMLKVKVPEGEEKEWNKWGDISLSYFVVMGGFRVGVENPGQQAPGSDPELTAESVHELTVGVEKAAAATENKDPNQTGNPPEIRDDFGFTLTPHGVLFLAQQGGFPSAMTLEQLKDRSKASTLAKVIVMLQATWTVLQVLSRAAAGLTVTQLEIHVILHVLCSLGMYSIWWDKPVDIEFQEPVLINEAQMKLLQTSEPDLLKGNPTNPFQVYTPADAESPRKAQIKYDPEHKLTDGYLITRSGLGKLLYIQLCDKRSIFSNYFSVICRAFGRIIEARNNIWKEGLALNVIALSYGGGHLLAWNNYFPTDEELWLWRGSSFLTAVSVLAFILSLYIGAMLKGVVGDKKVVDYYRYFCGFALGLGIVPVLFARLFLLLESVIALRSVPINVYHTVAWTETWPHFA